MRPNIHPTLNRVCFVDQSTGKRILSRSTMRSEQTETINGEKYFVVTCAVTSDSHPAYTGEERFIDTAGRIEKFNRRYASVGGGRRAGGGGAAQG